MKSLLTLGRQPKLGIAELESLFGAEAVTPFGAQAVFLDVEPEHVPFARLGGSTRLCSKLAQLPSPNWPDIRDYIAKSIPEQEHYVPEGKLTIGLSVIGVKTSIKDIERCLLTAKKAVKALGRSVRIVPNKQLELNAAQIIHNGLTNTNGWELVVISDGQNAWLSQTVNVQDIEGYAARDQARPYRDARVGMLPPKLAQTIINLGASSLQPTKQLLLDPFCGTGVVLQEASLMGFDVYGTDINPRMVEYTIGNLHWLREKFDVAGEYVRIELGDATKHGWQQPINVVACETYLGQPLMSLPNSEHLSKIIYETNLINHNFIKNLAPQLKSGTRICLAVPAWRGKHEFLHLPMLDHLTELGYNRVKFVHASNSDLIYHRENQVVARELIVLVKS
ncbi:hypothetical protein EB118_01280 [bacterium]|nr:hypothetical protein [bacterium]NBX97876.1 hypothetical protein [bacterium]NDC93884.1 hypothetical protein [bacterium]NDD82831.1 hypothetical protein [bacterium]NDG28721.1 hypothetical protein [bacterium]